MIDDAFSRVPEDLRAPLRAFHADLARAADGNLAGVIIFGGVARGRWVKGRSDVNAVVLLHRTGIEELRKITPAMRAAFRSVRLEPMVTTAAEVRASVDVFPTKFLDICAHHLVLAGDNPFAQLRVDDEHLRLRVEQELRNLSLRLRRRFIFVADDPVQLVHTIANATTSLSIELSALLRLSKQPTPASDEPADVFAAAASAFGLDHQALAQVARLKVRPDPNQEGLVEIYDGLLRSIAIAIERVDTHAQVDGGTGRRGHG